MIAGDAGILSVPFFKQTFALYLPGLSTLWLVFFFISSGFLLPHATAVDDNLASVFICLHSRDNDHGTTATESLWEDEH